MPRIAIAVIGAGSCTEEENVAAYEVGRLVAERGAVLVTGGGAGVMEAASRGARDAGGLVVGILPGRDPEEANSAVDVAIPTGMGQLRNGLVVNSGCAVIAIGGEWGTLSEIGLALKLGIPIFGLNSWKLDHKNGLRNGMVPVGSPADAVEQAFLSLGE